VVKRGIVRFFKRAISPPIRMKDFLGQFDAKIDAKGRVRFPKTLKQQLPDSHDGRFIIKRGFEKCIEVYPFAVWEKELERIKSLNRIRRSIDFD